MSGLLACAGAAALLLFGSAVTARRPAGPLPDLLGYYQRWSALHGGYDPRSSVWTRGWLRGIFQVAHPLAALGVAPDVLTLWGGLAAGLVPALAALGSRWPLLAVPVVVVSGLTDNLDGAVAALTDRSSPFGAVLDSVVDRLADAFYLVALWTLGAQPGLCVGAAAVAGLQEYARARAGAVGMREVGVVTVSERPTRVILTAFGLLAAGLAPAYATATATAATAALLGVGLVGFGQLLVVLRRRLR